MTDLDVAKLAKSPAVLGALGLAAFLLLTTPRRYRPEWAKNLPYLGGRRAGPWRGKGSFGKGFGPQTRRK